MDFNLAETLATFSNNRNELIENDYEDLDDTLNKLIDALAVSPDELEDNNFWQSALFLLKYVIFHIARKA